MKISRALIALSALTATTLFAAPAAAGDVTLITGKPPSAERLARMLYPYTPNTRSIVMKKVGTPFAFNVQFDLDSAEIKPESRPYLDRVGKMLGLSQMAGRGLQIEGHADASGGDVYNLELSERRARAVAQYLSRHHGVDLRRMRTEGKGEREPLADRPAHDAANRRVQFAPL